MLHSQSTRKLVARTLCDFGKNFPKGKKKRGGEKKRRWGNLTAHCPKDKSHISHFSVPSSPTQAVPTLAPASQLTAQQQHKNISAKVHGLIHLNNSSQFKKKTGELRCQHKIEVESISTRRRRWEQKLLLEATASCHLGSPHLWQYVQRMQSKNQYTLNICLF